jgi:ketose-bisphosphate aldolase
MMNHAVQHQYAVGYFESWNFESLQGTIDAAEQTQSPVIIGFNGEFLSHLERKAQEQLEWYGALGRAAAETASVPCGFIFNECSDDGWVRRAVKAGFNLVMPVPAEDEGEDAYTARVRAMVEYAHGQGVSVEAELGKLPDGAAGVSGGEVTDPARVAAFVAATGIDVLAISAGNVHVLLRGEQGLDIERIAAIREVVSVPLVLHGGTGIDAESLKQAIALGVAKVNYGTVLKLRYLEAVRRGLTPPPDPTSLRGYSSPFESPEFREGEQEHALNSQDINPHHLLGYGGGEDVMVAGRLAVREAVIEKMEILGCCGKAYGR